MNPLDILRKEFEQYLYNQIPDKEPANLYVPLHYVLQNGGKRIRPLLVLLATKSFGKDYKTGLPAAAAIETFHNFTLIHDDIMDKAPIRRGKPTVHVQWDENLAILSGDTMLVWAYKMLENYDGETYKRLSSLLNQTAIEVCEGQQMDMDFETRDEVHIAEYVEMIRLKTAVLLGAALQFGGIVSHTTPQNLKHISGFGINLGLAFQIQDDYLDTFGDTESFGKKIGGDIIDRKKTFLYISALENANANDRKTLLNWYKNDDLLPEELIKKVVGMFTRYKIDNLAKKAIDVYTQSALQELDKLDIPDSEKQFWQEFAFNLMHRKR